MEEKLKKIIFHVDVNSAFLSWSAVHKLKEGCKVDLRRIPSVIGGDEKSRRGVVLAKSVPAKKFGIITGESIFTARKKCPNLMVVPSDFHIYRQYSEDMMQLLQQYTDKIQKYSIDECFLDLSEHEKVSNSLNKMDEAYKLAVEIKNKILKELGFTVNIGISNNKLLAKMASDFEKPNKIHTLYPWEIKKKMWPMDVGDLFMVGKKSVPKLNNLNIYTIGDLAQYDLNILKEKFKSKGLIMKNYANGIDDSEVQCNNREIKGISNSTTLSSDITTVEEAYKIIKILGEKVSDRLLKSNKFCSSISVSIRNSDFKDYSHQRTLSFPTDSSKVIISTARELFKERWQGDPIRLLGISLTNLSYKEIQQMNIFDAIKSKEQEKTNKLNKTIDDLNRKYGSNSVLRLKDMVD